MSLYMQHISQSIILVSEYTGDVVHTRDAGQNVKYRFPICVSIPLLYIHYSIYILILCLVTQCLSGFPKYRVINILNLIDILKVDIYMNRYIIDRVAETREQRGA